MVSEYLKPMLDVGSPRVLNVNVLTRRIYEENPEAITFFYNKPLNNLVLIKDTAPDLDPRSSRSSIGTKLYFPFNENDIYEGGRTIFAHDTHLEGALKENFGEGALDRDALTRDMRVLSILDGLPSLDPFLLKDVFRNEGIDITESYFEVGAEVWREIELYVLQKFEPLVRAAFPDAMASDEKARKLVEKIWEARDLDVLLPLSMAFRLPKGEELQIFAAWKGINYYSYQYEKNKSMLMELAAWLKELKIPLGAVSGPERDELKAMLEGIKIGLSNELRQTESILREYQDAYDKMFKLRTSSAEFVTFLKNSNKAYWSLGNALGRSGHAIYCWNMMSKRYPGRKLPWEQTLEIIKLLGKIYRVQQKAATAMAW